MSDSPLLYKSNDLVICQFIVTVSYIVKGTRAGDSFVVLKFFPKNILYLSQFR